MRGQGMPGVGRGGVRSVQQAQVGGACLHCVDDQLVAAIEAQDDDLEDAASGVEPQTELAGRVTLVRFTGIRPVCGSVDGILRSHAVLERGRVDLHAT